MVQNGLWFKNGTSCPKMIQNDLWFKNGPSCPKLVQTGLCFKNGFKKVQKKITMVENKMQIFDQKNSKSSPKMAKKWFKKWSQTCWITL